MMLALLLLQPVKWHESDECEKCSSPFFWNLKLMWEAKTIGGRQVSYWQLLLMVVVILVSSEVLNNSFRFAAEICIRRQVKAIQMRRTRCLFA